RLGPGLPRRRAGAVRRGVRGGHHAHAVHPGGSLTSMTIDVRSAAAHSEDTLRARRRRRARLRSNGLAWAFIAPLLLVNLLVITGPGLSAVYFSFTDWNGLGQPNFIGFANYVEMFSSEAVLNALG